MAEKKFKCTFCDKTFARSNALSKHVRKFHNDDQGSRLDSQSDTDEEAILPILPKENSIQIPPKDVLIPIPPKETVDLVMEEKKDETFKLVDVGSDSFKDSNNLIDECLRIVYDSIGDDMKPIDESILRSILSLKTKKWSPEFRNCLAMKLSSDMKDLQFKYETELYMLEKKFEKVLQNNGEIHRLLVQRQSLMKLNNANLKLENDFIRFYLSRMKVMIDHKTVSERQSKISYECFITFLQSEKENNTHWNPFHRFVDLSSFVFIIIAFVIGMLVMIVIV